MSHPALIISPVINGITTRRESQYAIVAMHVKFRKGKSPSWLLERLRGPFWRQFAGFRVKHGNPRAATLASGHYSHSLLYWSEQASRLSEQSTPSRTGSGTNLKLNGAKWHRLKCGDLKKAGHVLESPSCSSPGSSRHEVNIDNMLWLYCGSSI
jgi:hypothetical protein